MVVDSIVLAEALTALLGVTVSIQSKTSESDGAIQLDVTSLPTVAVLGYEALSGKYDPVSSLISRLLRWFLGDQSQKTPDNESSSDSFDSSDDEDFVDDSSPETPKKESTNTSTSLRKALFVIPDDFFDPGYDFDFTHMSESTSDSECKRGGETYKRPYGWMRFALKVKDKYPDGNTWLGTGGWRNRSSPGEWPVSYHGTSLKEAQGIVKTHYKAGDGKTFGRGIYSSPEIRVADGYAKKFTSQSNGKTYKVIMQNRINPKKREIIKEKNYWLVPIPEGTSAEKEKEIVESAIRPYGLLIKEM